MSAPKPRTIAVLGSPAVGKLRYFAIWHDYFIKLYFNFIGKSSLTIQFVENHFVDSYYPTIENTFNKVIRYRGQEIAAEIIDTAGQVIVDFQNASISFTFN